MNNFSLSNPRDHTGKNKQKSKKLTINETDKSTFT